MRVDTNVIVVALCYFLTNEKNVDLWYYVFVIRFDSFVVFGPGFSTYYLLFTTH